MILTLRKLAQVVIESFRENHPELTFDEDP